MRITNYQNDADITAAFKSYVERRLHFALGRYGDRVGTIAVRIVADGPSARCRVSADIRPFGRVSVDESDVDMFTAIDRATGRIGRVFGRELERARDARVGRESVRTAA
jgi:putative sigma-54 modulation protein